MIASHPVDYYLRRYPRIATLAYVAIVTALLLTALFASVSIFDRYRAVSASTEILTKIRHHGRSSYAPPSGVESVSTGSPFLEGQSVTVASAALLQQITRAVTRAGGSIVSSEVERQDEKTQDAYVRVSVTCELEQTALQSLLYHIEAGMPFLFIDRLVALAPLPSSGNERMHVVLAVSGLWWDAK